MKRKRPAAEDIEQSALHGNAVAGPSKLVSEQPQERKLKSESPPLIQTLFAELMNVACISFHCLSAF